jgi:hypothetical protein
VSDKSLHGWNQMLRDQHGFHFQNAGHFQQSGDPEVTATLDTGNRALGLTDARTEIGLGEAL